MREKTVGAAGVTGTFAVAADGTEIGGEVTTAPGERLPPCGELLSGVTRSRAVLLLAGVGSSANAGDPLLDSDVVPTSFDNTVPEEEEDAGCAGDDDDVQSLGDLAGVV
jgi:hypothetical protein